MTEPLSRRDFLKVASAGALGLAFSKPIEVIDKVNIAVEQEKSFETDKAIYIPFFENHTIGVKTERIINTKPDDLFIEFAQKSDNLLNRPPFKILSSSSGIINNGIFTEGVIITTGKFLSDELLLGLDKIGSSVAVEGLDTPPKLEKQTAITNIITDLGSPSGAFITLGVAIKNLIKSKEFSKGDYTRIYASILASFWAGSDDLSVSNLVDNFNTLEDTVEIKNAQNVANRLHAVITFTHPEDVVIFMRNIFMSLKLITLSEQEIENDDEKIKIAFRIGAAHGAVSDMVKIGKDITIRFLDIYSNNILKQVIDYNTSIDKTFEERIDDFCKTIVIPVHEARMSNTGTRYLIDEKLKNYLLQRFSDS